MSNFKEIIQTNFVYSEAQRDVRKYGNSEIQYSGQPTIYHAGDVINLPYVSGERSTIEAIGLAWEAYASGILPSGIT